MPTDTFFHPNRLQELKDEKPEEKKDEKQEEIKEKLKETQLQKESPTPFQINVFSTVLKLRRDLHKAEEQRARVRWRRKY